MKIIDLYKLISNKEIDKLPKKIKWRNVTYDLDIDEEFINYNPQDHSDWLLNQYLWKLNEEVETLEEEKKDNFTGWKIYQDGIEICSMDCSGEEKKIPEKLEILPDNEHYSNKVLYGKINEIIDYLKSKGE